MSRRRAVTFRKVVEDLNRSIAPRRGVVLDVVTWEDDAFPGYGMDAQALINAQIAEMTNYSMVRLPQSRNSTCCQISGRAESTTRTLGGVSISPFTLAWDRILKFLPELPKPRDWESAEVCAARQTGDREAVKGN